MSYNSQPTAYSLAFTTHEKSVVLPYQLGNSAKRETQPIIASMQFQSVNPLLASARITHLLHSTKAEEAFAWMLHKEGVSHVREHIISGMTVDFYLPFYNAVVEIDGKSHGRVDKLTRDEKRDRYLRKRGYQVIRIPNYAVYRDGGKTALFSALDKKGTKVYT